MLVLCAWVLKVLNSHKKRHKKNSVKVRRQIQSSAILQHESSSKPRESNRTGLPLSVASLVSVPGLPGVVTERQKCNMAQEIKGHLKVKGHNGEMQCKGYSQSHAEVKGYGSPGAKCHYRGRRYHHYQGVKGNKKPKVIEKVKDPELKDHRKSQRTFGPKGLGAKWETRGLFS